VNPDEGREERGKWEMKENRVERKGMNEK